jgi:hypothetical protein
VSALEPLICFLPEEKSLVQRYLSWLYFHLINFLAFPVEFLKRVYLGTTASIPFFVISNNVYHTRMSIHCTFEKIHHHSNNS